MKHSNKLKREIEIINKGNKIKVRMRKTKSGYSLYLDLFSNGKRQREWLEPKLSGKESDWDNDKEKLIYAKYLRNEKEKTRYQNFHNFKLTDQSKEIIFLDYFNKIKETKKESTKGSWKATIKHFKRFLKEYGYSELLALANVENDKQISKDFANYLTSLKEIKNITASKYFATYIALLNHALKDELINKNPAKYISIEYEKTKKEYLTMQELEALEKTKYPNKHIRNAFLFSCYTGLRLSDIININFDNVQKNKNGLQIYIEMQKSKKYITIPVIDEAKEIINEQRKTQKGNKIFTLPAKPWLGNVIKIWTARAGIDKKITFHNARHTFVTLLITAGVDIYAIKELCGHSSVAVTERAYANLIDTKRFNEMEKLSNYFKKDIENG